jgi:hypothetical protein
VTERRRKLPLWQWPPLVVVVVFALALVMVNLAHLGIPIVTVLVTVVGATVLVLAVLWAVREQWRRRHVANPPGSLLTVEGLELVELAADAVVFLEETSRRQASIDIALTSSDQPLEAVLCPGATRFLGREYRTEVYLVAGGKPHPAGFLPRKRDALMADGLAKLAAKGVYVRVPATVLGAGKAPDPARPLRLLSRPFTVSVGVGSLDEILRERGIAGGQEAS